MDSFGLGFVAKLKLYAGFAAFIDAHTNYCTQISERSLSEHTAQTLLLVK